MNSEQLTLFIVRNFCHNAVDNHLRMCEVRNLFLKGVASILRHSETVISCGIVLAFFENPNISLDIRMRLYHTFCKEIFAVNDDKISHNILKRLFLKRLIHCAFNEGARYDRIRQLFEQAKQDNILDTDLFSSLMMEADDADEFSKVHFMFYEGLRLINPDTNFYNTYMMAADNNHYFHEVACAFTQAEQRGLADATTYIVYMTAADAFHMVYAAFYQAVNTIIPDIAFYNTYMSAARSAGNFAEVDAAFMRAKTAGLVDLMTYIIYMAAADDARFFKKANAAFYEGLQFQNALSALFYNTYMIAADNVGDFNAVHCAYSLAERDGKQDFITHMTYVHAAIGAKDFYRIDFNAIDRAFAKAQDDTGNLNDLFNLYAFYFKAAHRAGLFETRIFQLKTFSQGFMTKQFFKVIDKEAIQLDCHGFSVKQLWFTLKMLLAFCALPRKFLLILGQRTHTLLGHANLVDGLDFFIVYLKERYGLSLDVAQGRKNRGLYILKVSNPCAHINALAQTIVLPDYMLFQEKLKAAAIKTSVNAFQVTEPLDSYSHERERGQAGKNSQSARKRSISALGIFTENTPIKRPSPGIFITIEGDVREIRITP